MSKGCGIIEPLVLGYSPPTVTGPENFPCSNWWNQFSKILVLSGVVGALVRIVLLRFAHHPRIDVFRMGLEYAWISMIIIPFQEQLNTARV